MRPRAVLVVVLLFLISDPVLAGISSSQRGGSAEVGNMRTTLLSVAARMKDMGPFGGAYAVLLLIVPLFLFAMIPGLFFLYKTSEKRRAVMFRRLATINNKHADGFLFMVAALTGMFLFCMCQNVGTRFDVFTFIGAMIYMCAGLSMLFLWWVDKGRFWNNDKTQIEEKAQPDDHPLFYVICIPLFLAGGAGFSLGQLFTEDVEVWRKVVYAIMFTICVLLMIFIIVAEVIKVEGIKGLPYPSPGSMVYPVVAFIVIGIATVQVLLSLIDTNSISEELTHLGRVGVIAGVVGFFLVIISNILEGIVRSEQRAVKVIVLIMYIIGMGLVGVGMFCLHTSLAPQEESLVFTMLMFFVLAWGDAVMMRVDPFFKKAPRFKSAKLDYENQKSQGVDPSDCEKLVVGYQRAARFFEKEPNNCMLYAVTLEQKCTLSYAEGSRLSTYYNGLAKQANSAGGVSELVSLMAFYSNADGLITEHGIVQALLEPMHPDSWNVARGMLKQMCKMSDFKSTCGAQIRPKPVGSTAPHLPSSVNFDD